MRRSKLTEFDPRDTWFAGAGTASQVLDERMVARSLRRDSDDSPCHGDIILALRTSLALGTVFWLALYGFIRLLTATH